MKFWAALLSKYVVDAYPFLLSEKANQKNLRIILCLDCDQRSMIIINKRPIKYRTTFARTMLANSNQLKNLIFLLLVGRRHLMLLCICKAIIIA